MPAEKIYGPTQDQIEGREHPAFTVRWGSEQDTVDLVLPDMSTIKFDEPDLIDKLIATLRKARRKVWPSEVSDNHKNWRAYMEANGIDPLSVVESPSPVRHVVADGSAQIHFLQFVLAEDGCKQIEKNGYLKRPAMVVEAVPPTVDLHPIAPVWQ